jgi:zinc/manganese transport system substrate-binding protein
VNNRVMLLGCSAAVLIACGNGQPDSATLQPVPIIATTSIWADIASNVACGEEVASLIPAGGDPHTFEPSLRDRELIERPAAIIANGGGLEGPVTDLLTTVDGRPGTSVYDMTAGVDVVDGDPHVWQDPTLVATAIDAIAAAAVAVGRDPADIATCTDAYRSELMALDAEIAELLRPIPTENRVMVTSHDSLEYFARRYDIEVVGTVIPSTNTLAESNAADLAVLAELITERHVPAIFTERLESTTDAEALANRLDVRIVPLVTDALTDQPGTDTYVGMMRSNATTIAEALAP